MEQVFRSASDEKTAGNDMVVATVVKTSGSTPQKPGAKLLVRADGSGVGTLGGGCVEGDIWFAASQLLKSGGSAEMRVERRPRSPGRTRLRRDDVFPARSGSKRSQNPRFQR